VDRGSGRIAVAEQQHRLAFSFHTTTGSVHIKSVMLGLVGLGLEGYGLVA